MFAYNDFGAHSAMSGFCIFQTHNIPGGDSKLKWLLMPGSELYQESGADYRYNPKIVNLLDPDIAPANDSAVKWFVERSGKKENRRRHLRYFVHDQGGKLVYWRSEIVVHH